MNTLPTSMADALNAAAHGAAQNAVEGAAAGARAVLPQFLGEVAGQARTQGLPLATEAGRAAAQGAADSAREAAGGLRLPEGAGKIAAAGGVVLLLVGGLAAFALGRANRAAAVSSFSSGSEVWRHDGAVAAQADWEDGTRQVSSQKLRTSLYRRILKSFRDLEYDDEFLSADNAYVASALTLLVDGYTAEWKTLGGTVIP